MLMVYCGITLAYIYSLECIRLRVLGRVLARVSTEGIDILESLGEAMRGEGWL